MAKSELWIAIKELYLWRQGKNKSWTAGVFDRLAQGQDEDFITKNCPTLRTAYDLWKNHKDEEVFFKLNHLKPDDD